MAAQKFRNWSVYINGKRASNTNKGSLDLMSGNEQYVGDGGWLGSAIGKRTSKITFDQFVPVGGKPEIDVLIAAWKAGDYINISLGIINGKIFKFPEASITDLKFDAEMAKGTSACSITIESGEPDITG